MVESDPNKMDWEDLFTMWLFELGASNMDINMENNNINFVFGDDAKTTKDLQVQEGVLEARNEAIINIKRRFIHRCRPYLVIMMLMSSLMGL